MPQKFFRKFIRVIPLIILLFTAAVQSEQAHIRFDSLHVESQILVGSLHIQKLMDKQIMKGLRKGMTTVIEYRVQIWHERNRWMKSLINERYRRIKINFSHWERKYQVHFKDGEIRLFEEPDLITYCQHLSSFSMAKIEDLVDQNEYRIVAQVSIKPMSMENIQELRRWLSGEADEFDPKDIRINKSPLKKTGDWILNLFVNVTGFGDRVITHKSSKFFISDGRLLLEEDL